MIEEQSFLTTLQQLPLPAQKEVFHASELAYYQAVYANLSVLLHDFQTEVNFSDTEKEDISIDYEQIDIYFSVRVTELPEEKLVRFFRWIKD